jgi:hypothetical protein
MTCEMYRRSRLSPTAVTDALSTRWSSGNTEHFTGAMAAGNDSTRRFSSPGRTEKQCSRMPVMIRPMPKDGSMTDGVKLSEDTIFSLKVNVTMSRGMANSLPATVSGAEPADASCASNARAAATSSDSCDAERTTSSTQSDAHTTNMRKRLHAWQHQSIAARDAPSQWPRTRCLRRP